MSQQINRQSFEEEAMRFEQQSPSQLLVTGLQRGVILSDIGDLYTDTAKGQRSFWFVSPHSSNQTQHKMLATPAAPHSTAAPFPRRYPLAQRATLAPLAIRRGALNNARHPRYLLHAT